LTVLALDVVAAAVGLAAIAGEPAVVKDMDDFIKLTQVALAGGAVLSSWAFIR
jgi:hypothetical protein